jgi:hypothetical protein
MTVSDRTIERLLTEAHAAAGPSGEQRLRALRRLESSLGSPPLLPPSSFTGAARLSDGGGPAPPAAAVGTGFSPLAAVAVLAALLGLAAGYALLRSDNPPGPPSGSRSPSAAQSGHARAQSEATPAHVERPVPPAPPAPSSEPLRAGAAGPSQPLAPSPSRRDSPVAAGSSTPPARVPDAPAGPADLHEALALLRASQRELGAHHADRSLALLAELEARAPELLIEERDTTRVLAWCERGEPERARTLARALRAAHPESVYRQRIAASCAASADTERVLEEIRRRAPN